LGQGSSLRPADMFYGKRSAGNEWGAAATMRVSAVGGLAYVSRWIPRMIFFEKPRIN